MAKKILTNEPGYLSMDELKILDKCSKDIFFFFTFLWVINPVAGRVQFNLYPYQRSVLYQFMKERFNIILKFRQAGITELIAGYCLWLCLFHDNKKVNIISIKDIVAKKVLKKIKFMYKNLPWYLQTPITNGRRGEYGSASSMEFSNGSFIESIPTSDQAGRSESLSLLVIDEAAIVRWASTIWASAFPTLSTGGSAIVNSTPYGIGNFYHSTWVDSLVGGNPFNPLRLYWQMHPERDERWYKEMAAALGPKRTAQEIDGDFLSSGNTVFDLTDIKAIEDMLTEYPALQIRYNSQYRQFNKPQKDKLYFIGADVGTGKSVDYSAFSCMDEFGEDQACYKGRIAVDKYAKLLGDTGALFNYAVLAPETNDVGLAVTSWLQTNGYPNLYHYTKILKKGKGKSKNRPEIEQFPGWLTTSKNRSIIIEQLEQDIREDNLIIKDPFFVNEAYTFIYDGNGRPIAKGKRKVNANAAELDLDEDATYSDDAIFGKAITNHIRRTYKRKVIVQPT